MKLTIEIPDHLKELLVDFLEVAPEIVEVNAYYEIEQDEREIIEILKQIARDLKNQIG